MAAVRSVAFGVEKCPAQYVDNQSEKLTERYRVIAKDELGEDPERQAAAVAQLRQWISEHPHIRSCRTDALFLLRFLRAREYDLEKVRTTIERYLSMRQVFRLWYENLDPVDRYMKELVDTRGCLPLGLDNHGRMVGLVRVKRFDMSRFNCYHLGRFQHMLFEAFFDDEEVQIAGGVAIIDCDGATMGHFMCFKLTDIRNFLDCIQHALPIRVQEVHIVHLPLFGKTLGNLVLSFASEDLRRRIFFHSTMEQAMAKVDRSLLPTEYGGLVDPDVVTEQLKARLTLKRDHLLLLDQMGIDPLGPYANFWQQNNEEDDIEFGTEID